MLYAKICGGDNFRFNLGRGIPRLGRSAWTLRKDRFIIKFSRPTVLWGHAVAYLVEALRYKPEGCEFDSRWCHRNFSLI